MREKKTQRDEKKILYYAISLTTINIILWVIALKSNPANPSRTTFLSSGVMKFILLYIPLGVSSFILGLLVSLIPYRELKFGEKYIRSSLLSFIALSILLLVFIIRSLILF